MTGFDADMYRRLVESSPEPYERGSEARPLADEEEAQARQDGTRPIVAWDFNVEVD